MVAFDWRGTGASSWRSPFCLFHLVLFQGWMITRARLRTSSTTLSSSASPWAEAMPCYFHGSSAKTQCKHLGARPATRGAVALALRAAQPLSNQSTPSWSHPCRDVAPVSEHAGALPVASRQVQGQRWLVFSQRFLRLGRCDLQHATERNGREQCEDLLPHHPVAVLWTATLALPLREFPSECKYSATLPRQDRTNPRTCSGKAQECQNVKRPYAPQDVSAANRPQCVAPCGQNAQALDNRHLQWALRSQDAMSQHLPSGLSCKNLMKHKALRGRTRFCPRRHHFPSRAHLLEVILAPTQHWSESG